MKYMPTQNILPADLQYWELYLLLSAELSVSIQERADPYDAAGIFFRFIFCSAFDFPTVEAVNGIKIELQGFEKFVLGMTVMFPAGEIEDVKILNGEG